MRRRRPPGQKAADSPKTRNLPTRDTRFVLAPFFVTVIVASGTSDQIPGGSGSAPDAGGADASGPSSRPSGSDVSNTSEDASTEGEDASGPGADGAGPREAGSETDATVDNTPRAPVDMLFVVDNSGSMEDKQELLASGFSAFVAKLEDRVDYRIAVITADLTSAGVSAKESLCRPSPNPTLRPNSGLSI